MKPVLVLQHLNADGPGHLGAWLAREGLAFELRNSEAGDGFPDHIDGYAALAVLGGEMSANDPLPSLRRAERLILEAFDAGCPVIGHCLGGQLMARALGARVVDSPAPEIGWQPITIADHPAAREWFGQRRRPRVFQWHYEAFELPPGATLLAGSAACPHQAFAIGPHLAMQFHIEVDADKVTRWSHDDGARFLDARAAHPATVQDGAAMRAAIGHELRWHQVLAERLYGRWAGALRRG